MGTVECRFLHQKSAVRHSKHQNVRAHGFSVDFFRFERHNNVVFCVWNELECTETSSPISLLTNRLVFYCFEGIGGLEQKVGSLVFVLVFIVGFVRDTPTIRLK